MISYIIYQILRQYSLISRNGSGHYRMQFTKPNDNQNYRREPFVFLWRKKITIIHKRSRGALKVEKQWQSKKDQYRMFPQQPAYPTLLKMGPTPFPCFLTLDIIPPPHTRAKCPPQHTPSWTKTQIWRDRNLNTLRNHAEMHRDISKPSKLYTMH